MRGIGAAVAVVVLIGSLVRPVVADAADAEEVRAALRATTRARATVQRELPRDPVVTPRPDDHAPAADPGPGEEDDPGRSATPWFLGSLSRILLWGLVIAAVLALLGWLASEIISGRRRAAANGPILVPEGAPPELAGDRPDPQALAAAGRWDEAVHALLLDALFVLGTRARISEAMTGRELVASLTMPEPARPALGALVAHVERTLFAGMPADPAIFAAAERDHRAFRAGLSS